MAGNYDGRSCSRFECPSRNSCVSRTLTEETLDNSNFLGNSNLTSRES